MDKIIKKLGLCVIIFIVCINTTVKAVDNDTTNANIDSEQIVEKNETEKNTNTDIETNKEIEKKEEADSDKEQETIQNTQEENNTITNTKKNETKVNTETKTKITNATNSKSEKNENSEQENNKETNKINVEDKESQIVNAEKVNIDDSEYYTEDIFLEELSVEGYEFLQAFRKNVYTYRIIIKDEECTSIKVNAKANKEDSTIEIIGEDFIEHGENVVTIVLTSNDGTNIKTYQIIVNKGNILFDKIKKLFNDNIFLILVTLLFVLCIIKIIANIYVAKKQADEKKEKKSKRKNTENKVKTEDEDSMQSKKKRTRLKSEESNTTKHNTKKRRSKGKH